MSVLGNVLWVILGGGLILFLEYLISGLLLCLTIVGIPFGTQCIKLAALALLPFGKEVHTTTKGTGCVATMMNVLWIVTGGVTIAITHIVFAIICALTIVGLPFAKQHLKLAGLALTPFGKTIS